MVDTVRLGGIKLSGEMAQLDLRSPFCPDEKLVGFLQRVSTAKINIPHLHQGFVGNAKQTTLCITSEDYLRLKVEGVAELADGWGKMLPSVGTLSLFPHGYNLDFIARVISSLARESFPIYGISTSVSALVVHTDYSLLEKAVDVVLKIAELPANHTPLRPVVVLGDEVIETIAVYWESKIRIYGMDIQTGLSSIRLNCSATDLANKPWRHLKFGDTKFRLLTSQSPAEGIISFHFLIAGNNADNMYTILERIAGNSPHAELYREDNTELISFHGPHFQDRYGIADAAFSRLLDNGHTLLASGCTGTTIQLLVSAGMSDSVSGSLANTFIVPSPDDLRKNT